MQGTWKDTYATVGSITLNRDACTWANSTIIKILKPTQMDATVEWQVQLVLSSRVPPEGNSSTDIDIAVELAAMRNSSPRRLVAVPGVPAVARVEVHESNQPASASGSHCSHGYYIGRNGRCPYNCFATTTTLATWDMGLTQACTFPTKHLHVTIANSSNSIEVRTTITHYENWISTSSDASSSNGVPLTSSLQVSTRGQNTSPGTGCLQEIDQVRCTPDDRLCLRVQQADVSLPHTLSEIIL